MEFMGAIGVMVFLLFCLWLLLMAARVILVFLTLSIIVYWVWGRDPQPTEQVCSKWDIVLVYPDGPMPYAGRPQRSCIEWKDAP